jgi:hypothetical protein
MSLSREQKRTVYYTYSEISESAKYAPALPCSGDTVQCSKGETGHGPWLDASIDFFALTGNNRFLLDRLHLDSDVRGSYTREHKRICRSFWRQVKAKALCDYGLFVSELM